MLTCGGENLGKSVDVDESSILKQPDVQVKPEQVAEVEINLAHGAGQKGAGDGQGGERTEEHCWRRLSLVEVVGCWRAARGGEGGLKECEGSTMGSRASGWDTVKSK